MKKIVAAALVLASLVVAAGGGGYWLGRQHGAPAQMASAGESFEFLRYSFKRKQSDSNDPYAHIADDDDRARNRPVEQVCLAFSRPLAKADAYEGRIKAATVEKLAVRVEQQSLCLSGWPSGLAALDLVLPAGLVAADGARTLAETKLRIDFKLDAKERLVTFAGTGSILPQVGATGIAIETKNVDRVRLRVLHVSDAKLMRDWPKHRAKRKTVENEAVEDDDDYYYYDNSLSRLNAGGGYVVWDGTMAVENRGEERSTTSFPLTRILPERRPGAYLLIAEDDAKASSRYNYYSSDAPATRWVIETDIGLTVLQGEDGLHLLARSYDTAKPIAGLDVALVAENRRDLGRATTDKDGRVRFERSLLQGQDGNRPQAVFAYGAEGAFAFLDLNRPAFDLSDRGVSGQPALRPLAAFLYADRGIYRPGERVHLSAMMRRDTSDALASPITLVIQRPNGAEFRRQTLPPDAGGGVHFSTELPPGAVRGLWSVLAFADPTDKPIGRLSFEVQDFVPQRLAVHGTISQPTYNPAAPPELQIDAQWLYGAPAAELQSFGELRIARDTNAFPQWRGWQIGRHDDPFEDVLLKLNAEATDGDGRAVIRLEPSNLGSTLPLKAITSFGVYEPGGRATEERLTLPVRHREVFLGIKPGFDDNKVANGTEAVLSVAAFDGEGRQIARPGVTWRLEREIWDYIWYRDDNRGGRWTYRTSVRLESVRSGDWSLTADKLQELRFVTDPWSRYRLTIEDKEAKAAASYRFASGFGNSSPDEDIPDKVAVSADKTGYAVGSKAQVSIKPPFAGEALVMVATNRILWSQHVSLPADGATVEIPVAADWGAGAYILVDTVRPLKGGSARDPVRAIGLNWLAIDNAARQVAVAMNVPELVPPQGKLTVPVSVSGLAPGTKTTLTIAAVDEGILALTRFVTPDPADFYFGKRRLGLDLRDDYGRLLDGQSAPAGRVRHGGDEVGGAGLQTVPTRTVALFSGPVEVDASGKASVDFDIPDFVGQLRLMAVAYNASQVGKGEARVRVRHPLVADAYFPRFLAPGDKARMTLFAQNVDAPEGSYSFAVSTSGVVTLTGERQLALPLAVRESKQASFELSAEQIGTGAITLAVSGPNGLAFTREWQIESRSPHYPVTLERKQMLAPGEAMTLGPDLLAPFHAGSVKLAVNLSAIRGIDVPGLMQSLSRYPYGCTEQITSVVQPLLSFDDFSLLGAASPAEVQRIRARVQQAIDTLLDRQGEDGVIGLWRVGDHGADSWLITYAIDFLQQARERGYTVPEDALQRSKKFLRMLVDGRSGENVDDDIYGYGPYAQANRLRARAYAHYLLARGGDPQRAMLQRQWGDFQKAGNGIASGFAAAALALSGERDQAAMIFRRGAGLIGDAQAVFYGSRLRDQALFAALAAESLGVAAAAPFFEQIEAANPAAERLTTQEKAWLLRAANAAKRNSELRVDDNGAERSRSNVVAMSLSPPVQALGTGYRITNRSALPVAASLMVHGAPRAAAPALESGYSLRKTVYTPGGDRIDLADANSIRRHDRLVVVLDGKVHDRLYHQTVLADLLPAGWEIETVIKPPRGRDDTPLSYPWLGALSLPMLAEQRDDRFVAAFELNNTARRDRFGFLYEREDSWRDRVLAPGSDFRFAYVVRAVTIGSFTLPAASVEDMYRPERMARTAAGSIVVRPE
ncbi:alpha-2-macroglobulin family protein [Ferrovibrio sp.]|uniref:alpha-2-macroglobulin family protein n=1 Tax=Ferrovibrio sp. TaxID=1917215 RepID=UPI003D0FA025